MFRRRRPATGGAAVRCQGTVVVQDYNAAVLPGIFSLYCLDFMINDSESVHIASQFRLRLTAPDMLYMILSFESVTLPPLSLTR